MKRNIAILFLVSVLMSLGFEAFAAKLELSVHKIPVSKHVAQKPGTDCGLSCGA